MATRLDRLVLLLDTGSSMVTRRTAARQLGDLQKKRPEDLHILLSRIFPFLSNKSWDTRSAAGMALEEVMGAVPIYVPAPDVPEEADTAKMAARIADQLNFETIDIKTVLEDGKPLLASVGKEFDLSLYDMSPQERLRIQRRSLQQTLGMASQFIDTNIVEEQDLQDAPPPSEVDVAPAAEFALDTSHMSKRELGALKRRKRMQGKGKLKIRALDMAQGSSSGGPSRESSSSAPASSISSDDRKQAQIQEADALKCPGEWPFAAACDRLLLGIFSPSWQERHGCGLGLRALFKTHAGTMGMRDGISPEENTSLHHNALTDAAVRLTCILALDRFGDYVSDQVITPAREVCAQALGALIHRAPDHIADLVFHQVTWLVQQPSTVPSSNPSTHIWEVRHAGLLALKYIVAVRPDRVPSWTPPLLAAILTGLGDEVDDVKAVAAAVLLPILHLCIDLPHSTKPLGRIAQVLWESLSTVKDDLASSVGAAMDLLAKLVSFPEALDGWKAYSVASGGPSLGYLIPSLFPFFRHTVPTVRIAVLQCASTFLDTTPGWVDERIFRLLLQNMVLETNPAILDISQTVWSKALDTASRSPSHPLPIVKTEAGLPPSSSSPPSTTIPAYNLISLAPYIPSWLYLILNPIGNPLPSSHFFQPALPGVSMADDMADQWHDIDKAMLQQDLALVPPTTILRNKLAASRAIGALMAHWSPDVLEADFLSPINDALSFPSTLAKALAATILEACVHALLAAGYPDLAPCLLQCISRFVTALEANVVERIEDLGELYLFKRQALSLTTEAATAFTAFTGNSLPHPIVMDINTTLQNPSLVNLAELTGWVQQMEKGIPTGKVVSLTKAAKDLLSTLQDSLARLSTYIEAEYKGEIEQMEITIMAAFAGVITASYRLPPKTGPLIRALMSAVKGQRQPLLQDRAVASLASLMHQAHLSPANAKVVKNLCSFLCADPANLPIFKGNFADASFDAPPSPADTEKNGANLAPSSAAEILEREKVAIRTRGALATLHAIATAFGPKLFVDIPTLLAKIQDPIDAYILSLSVSTSKGEDSLPQPSEGNVTPEQVQDVIDGLHIIESLYPHLDPISGGKIVDLLPRIVKHILFSDLSILRHMAARAIVTCSLGALVPAMQVVVDLALPVLPNPPSPHHRRGAIYLLYVLIDRLDLQILPYAMFLMMPVLRRMSDMDDAVRQLATLSFAHLLRLIPLEAGISDPEGFSKEQIKQREDERQFLEQLVGSSQVAPFHIPIKVHAQLRHYQQEGVNWLAFLNRYSLHGILCDDMGLGKTLQTICMVASDHANRAALHVKDPADPHGRPLPSIVVCPPTLTGHWEQELNTYVDGLRTMVYTGEPQERAHLVSLIPHHDIVVISYDILRNDIERLRHIHWDYCVLDEGHIIKNSATKTTQAVKRVIAEHRLILSGTPIQNNVLELYSLFDFLMPGFLGTEKQFQQKFGKPISHSRDAKSSSKEQEAGAMALEALHRQVLPFLLRRMKEDVLDDLPPKIIQDYYCDLSETQKKLYSDFAKSQVAETAKEDIKGDGKEAPQGQAMHIFQALQYLRKVCSHPLLAVTPSHPRYDRVMAMTPRERLDSSPKLLALQQLLKDCGIGATKTKGANSTEQAELLDGDAFTNHRVLIFCQLKSMLDLIEKELFREHMPTITYSRLDGGVEASKRHAIVQMFNADPSIDVLLLTTSVGGLGLNLTGADTVIFVEHDWNPMKDLQAMDRAHRLGQKRVVNVYRLITRGTLEEKIMGLQKFKLNIANSVVNQQNSSLESMNTSQLMDLFTPPSETSGDAGAKGGEADDISTTGLGGAAKAVIQDLEALWDADQYAEEFDLENYVSSLSK